jgi:ubiquitin C-terminal hydrolase
MSLYKTSKYLIIQLKRFKQKNNYLKIKIEKLVEFPDILDLSEQLVNKKTPMDDFPALRQLDPPINRSKSKYNLYAIINHEGMLGGGHYYAFAKNGSQWF